MKSAALQTPVARRGMTPAPRRSKHALRRFWPFSELGSLSLSTALLGFAHLLMPALLASQINIVDIAVRAEPEAVFRARSAAVENWRLEAATHLKLAAPSSLLLVFGARSEAVPRCVKLNNYWCVKGRGWSGQLGSDGNGHAAFAAARAGARAAAVLLRHYYVDLQRHSAIDITSHWAPDRCGPILARGHLPIWRPLVSLPPEQLDVARMTPKERMAAFDRIIAARRATAAVAYRQRLLLLKASNDRLTTPMASMTPTDPRPPMLRASPVAAPAAPIFCGFEQRRIASYARRARRGIALTPTDDLRLFTADGRSTWRAALMMTNMASVEIGPGAVVNETVTRALKDLDDEMAPASKKPGT